MPLRIEERRCEGGILSVHFQESATSFPLTPQRAAYYLGIDFTELPSLPVEKGIGREILAFGRCKVDGQEQPPNIIARNSYTDPALLEMAQYLMSHPLPTEEPGRRQLRTHPDSGTIEVQYREGSLTRIMILHTSNQPQVLRESLSRMGVLSEAFQSPNPRV